MRGRARALARKRALEGKADEFSLKPVTSNGAAYERAMTIATTWSADVDGGVHARVGDVRRGRMQN